MRCFLMRGGHIESVELLEPGSDEDLIVQGRMWFEVRKAEGRFDGFEVWDGARRLYTYPEEPSGAAS